MIFNERDYQRHLLRHLAVRFRKQGLWAIPGRQICYYSARLYPDVEVEQVTHQGIRLLAVIELKYDAPIDVFQAENYARLRNAPNFCIVDGFRRTPIRWFHCRPSAPAALIRSPDANLTFVARVIEDFNERKTTKEFNNG